MFNVHAFFFTTIDIVKVLLLVRVKVFVAVGIDMVLEMELIYRAVQLAEELCLRVSVQHQDILPKPEEMTDVIINQMPEPSLVGDALNEVDENAVHLLIENEIDLKVHIR